jgi:hypothetical protein
MERQDIFLRGWFWLMVSDGGVDLKEKNPRFGTQQIKGEETNAVVL